ncbi:MAG: DUF167 domain-containing protein [Acidobacteria bacterium]|nr:DUF167 domain-containing protein [Acidobacteriota bacterium]MBI3424590.1 DUF167 domain-containing protein [Acidobacteriota bacterium]
MVKLTARDNAVTFAVRVQPRASQTVIVGALDGALKLRLAAPPVDGAANAELIRWLAKFFDVPRAAIEILSGTTAKQKLIRVSGVQPAIAEQKISAALAQT